MQNIARVTFAMVKNKGHFFAILVSLLKTKSFLRIKESPKIMVHQFCYCFCSCTGAGCGNEVCGIRDQRCGIRDQKGGIRDHRPGIKDHKP